MEASVAQRNANLFRRGASPRADGALAAGWAADLLGRRGTLVLANAFLMAGALAMSAGASYAALMAARFVTSVGVGFARVVAPVYNAEISPASTRGVLSSLLDVCL